MVENTVAELDSPRLKAELLRDVATPPPQREAFRRFQEWTKCDADTAVLPLDLVQPDVPTIRSLKTLWRQRSEVYLFYLGREIFPKATPTQVKKFSACAQDKDDKDILILT